MRRSTRLVSSLLVAGLLAACGSGDGDDAATAAGDDTPAELDAADWDAVLAAAEGQTVNWYMYGGDDTLNTFINGTVRDALEEKGVTLNQVKITDTVDAVNKVLGEVQAGKDEGSVDAIWINGENFATGKQADLWYCGYAEDLPNAQFVDFDLPAVANDFGTPVEGCESVWQQANSALVYDSAKLSEADVESVDSLFAWAKENPGQLTYPAPPDFTGSMAVRTFLYDSAGGPDSLAEGTPTDAAYTDAATRTWQRLNAVEPFLYRQGKTYPSGQTDVEKLYSGGEVAAFLTYGPGGVGQQVADGVYPGTTKTAVLGVGNISNYNFVAIPKNASNKAAAMVLADTLLDPEVQLGLYEAAGTFPGIDLTKTDDAVRTRFAAVSTSEAVLPLEQLTENAQPELSADFVTQIEKDWKAAVLQK